jgi:DNA mismatch repair protein MutS2
MSLSLRITTELKEAIKAKDTIRISCLRMLKADLKNKQVEKGSDLEDIETQRVVSSLIRKGQEAAKEFRGGGRSDLAEKEEKEVRIFYEFLPEQLDSADIEEKIKVIISELSATEPKDLGKVMKAAMAQMGGRVQGNSQETFELTCMIQHTFRVLEFHTLLNILSNYASSPLGKSDCLSLEPSGDVRHIENEQKLVSEMKLLFQSEGFQSFEDLTDIGHHLRACQVEGTCLDPEDFLSIQRVAQGSKQAKKCLLSHQALYPSLSHLIEDLSLFEVLTKAVGKAISMDGTILDSASPALKNIRKKKALLRRTLQRDLEGICKFKELNEAGGEPLVSIRDGRYVIPIRTYMKNRVEGIVHDYSRTQATCYVEPIEIVKDNNKLSELNHIEKEEELKILLALTIAVRDDADDLDKAQIILGKLDGLYARARLSSAMRGVRPIMSHGENIDLREAKNPILLSLAPKGHVPVASDIVLDKNQNLMIISGPNRGGKTVTLKTLGLLSLMAQSGLHIPAAEGSSLPVFKNIMAEIGDDQNIQAGLSTFSAHASHLKHMMEHADKESLILIDEPGMGTDPDEGAALAMSVLDELTRKDAFVVVSTHLNRLKTYGLLQKRAINACMEFDPSTNRSLFSLRYGTPGSSCAFTVAHDAGIEPEVLNQAKDYLDQDEVQLNRLIDKLNRLKRETELEKLEAEHSKDKYRLAKEKVMQTLEKLETDRRALLKEKRSEAESLINQAGEELKELVNAFKRTGRSSQASIRQRFDQINKDLMKHLIFEEEIEPSESKGFEIGQWVRHKKHNQEGRILLIDQTKSKAVLMARNARLSVSLEDLDIIQDEGGPRSAESSGDVPFTGYGGGQREINLIGYRVADALPLIDKIIDRAMVEGEISLRIIHGYGTGQLRRAIREHLKGFSCVKKVSESDSQSGGDAITVVSLV